MKPNRRIIGITGNIATGKSAVTAHLRARGFRVIDADQVAREAVRAGSRGLREVVKRFGGEILLENGELNRSRLGEIVFNDPQALKQLNDTLHPLILASIDEKIKQCRETVIFVDGALLFETGYHRRVDEIWLVTASRTHQLQRLQSRDGLDADQAKKRMASQMDQRGG